MCIRRLLLALLAVASSGCVDTANMAFRVDSRLQFVAPHNRQLATLPLRLSWHIAGFRLAAPGSEPASRHAGSFALFVDRVPIKPGQTVRSVAAGDRPCQANPTCPDSQYLADRQVYLTSDPTFTLVQVRPLAEKDRTQLHDVTIVLLDTSGRRIGESSWLLQFRLRKGTFG
jgi:hypothetical protein